MNVLITGATGFIGKAVLARLLARDESVEIYLLVRSNLRTGAVARVEKMLEVMFPYSRIAYIKRRIQVIEGDLTKKDLALSANAKQLIIESVDQILHIGASTDFAAPLHLARLDNVEGTREVLALACACRQFGRLQRFDYVSTAFVAGTRAGWVAEDDLVRGQKFANSYEQSKYEAEVLVRSFADELPTTIYRPSIVVGDSNSGYTPHFKVLYWPLRLLSRQVLPFFACNLTAQLDVVPVDFVADGIINLMRDPAAAGQTFYLTAGEGQEIALRELLKDAYRFARIKPVPILPFWLFNSIRYSPLGRLFGPEIWQAVELARPYYPYLKGTGVVFDARWTQEYLRRFGLEAPRWNDYKREVLSFCEISCWGRQLPMPEYTYYLPTGS